jgi:hypothetical protein
MKYKNIVTTISNYATYMLQETLEDYGNKGYRLVNVVMANNTHNVPVMYCFFTKESKDVV